VASLASFGIWSELLLMQILVQHSYRSRFDSSHFAYALTELADECRHSVMFGRMLRAFGLPARRPRAPEFHALKLLGAVYDPMLMFAATLVIEEFTDAMQRLAFPDERVQPLVRQVSRIHVIEEARHIKYAREELKRQVARPQVHGGLRRGRPARRPGPRDLAEGGLPGAGLLDPAGQEMPDGAFAGV
jgi:hypothetical protein